MYHHTSKVSRTLLKSLKSLFAQPNVERSLFRVESEGHLLNFPSYDHVMLQLQWKYSLQWFCGMKLKKEVNQQYVTI